MLSPTDFGASRSAFRGVLPVLLRIGHAYLCRLPDPTATSGAMYS